jgi:TonB family protein
VRALLVYPESRRGARQKRVRALLGARQKRVRALLGARQKRVRALLGARQKRVRALLGARQKEGASMENKRKRRTEPEHATPETALDRCLVDGDAATKARDCRRRGEALGISFAIESAVLALLIVVPLMTSIAHPQLGHLIPPMPIMIGDWGAHHTPRGPMPRPFHHELNFPVRDFQPPVLGTVANSRQDAELDGDPSLVIPDGYIPGSIPMTDFSAPHPPVGPPSADTHKTSEKSIVKVSEGVQQAQLVSRIVPRYPPLAVQTRKEGTVLLHAIISIDGRITALEVVSGPPLLVQAAVDAVRQWRYRPTYLHGEPVEVETSITVIFRLGQ